MYALIRTTTAIAHAALNHSSQFHAALHVLTLDELEDDVTLGRLRVETLVSLLEALLHRNHRVLSHRHIQIVLGAMHTQRIGFEATCHLACRKRIGVHRDKQVGIGTIGDIRTLMKRNKHILLAGIDNTHLRHVLFHVFTEAQSHGKIDILLHGDGSSRTCIMAAMSWVDNQGKTLVGCESRHYQHTHQSQQQCYFLTHHSDDFAKLLLYYQKT